MHGKKSGFENTPRLPRNQAYNPFYFLMLKEYTVCNWCKLSYGIKDLRFKLYRPVMANRCFWMSLNRFWEQSGGGESVWNFTHGASTLPFNPVQGWEGFSTALKSAAEILKKRSGLRITCLTLNLTFVQIYSIFNIQQFFACLVHHDFWGSLYNPHPERSINPEGSTWLVFNLGRPFPLLPVAAAVNSKLEKTKKTPFLK